MSWGKEEDEISVEASVLQEQLGRLQRLVMELLRENESLRQAIEGGLSRNGSGRSVRSEG